MRELRSPPNPTRTLLTNRSEEVLDRFEERFQTRLDRRERKPKSALGSEPRVPTQVLAQAVKQLEAVAGDVTSQMRYALQKLLQSKAEHLDPDDIQDAIRRVSRIGVTNTTTANGLALATAKAVDKFNRRDVRRAIGVDVPEFRAPIGERWRREHISLIKSLPEDAKQRFTSVLREASRKQTRVETIARELEQQEGITHRRARLIARDQVLTLNAKLTRDRHERAGIEEYVWHTVRDGSVRSNHSHLHGKKFRYDAPPVDGGTQRGERGNPGDGIGCRCQAIPVIPEFAQPKQQPKPKAQPKPRLEKRPLKVAAPPTQAPRPPAQQPFVPPPLSREELMTVASDLGREMRVMESGGKSTAARTVVRSRMAKHGFTFEQRTNGGIVQNTQLDAHAAAHIIPVGPKFGQIELRNATYMESVLRRSRQDGRWERAHDPVVTLVHEETHMAASADPWSYANRGAPENLWIEEAATELAAQRVTSQWIGTQPLSYDKSGLSRKVAYQGTIEATLRITSQVLGVSPSEALDIVTEAGLAMRRPGDQTRTYIQAFLDGLPTTVTQAKKDQLAKMFRSEAASKFDPAKGHIVLDARDEPGEHWAKTLADIVHKHRRHPTAAEIDRAIDNSKPRSATTGAMHYMAMLGLSAQVNAALTKYGIKVVDDGNIYR